MNKTLEKILEDELFESETFEGEGSLSIKHTSEGTKLPITLIGKSTQETRDSYNLFNASKIKNQDIVVNDKGKKIVLPVLTAGNGYVGTETTLKELCPALKVDDNVYLFFTRNNSNYNNFIHLQQSNFTWNNKAKRTITDTDLNSTVVLYANRFQDGETEQITLTDFMITKQNDSTWQEYGVMPSPEFPSPIRSVADDINLFDEDDWYNTLHNVNSSNIIKEIVDGIEYIKFRPQHIDNIKYMQGKFKQNTRYTISCKARQYDYTDNTTTGFSIHYTDGSYSPSYIDKTLNEYNYSCITDENKTIDYISLCFNYNNFVLVRQIKLQEGIVATPYSEYGKGTVEIRNHGKNFIDINEFQSGHIISRDNKSITGNFTGNFQSGGRVNISLSNKKYLASIDISSSSTARLEINLMKNGEDKVIKITQHTYLIDNSNGEYDGVGITLSNGTYIGEVTFKNPQLEIVEDNNTIPTEYETYVGEDTVIQTAPLRSLPNGVCDEKDGNKTIRRVGRKIFDGTEIWYSYLVPGTELYSFYISVLGKKMGLQTSICSHFKNINWAFDKSVFKHGIYSDNTVNNFIYFDTNIQTIKEWKEFLVEEYAKGTPVTVYYELAEPEIEEANENKLANLTAYDGETNIFCTSEIPCGIKVDCKISKIKKLEEQINAQIGV